MSATVASAREVERGTRCFASNRRVVRMDDARARVRKPMHGCKKHVPMLYERQRRESARRSVEATAFDPNATLEVVSAFFTNPNPGLLPAVVANTAVFTSGFTVLRLGLTLAGIAHSWLLGTVRHPVCVFRRDVNLRTSNGVCRFHSFVWGVMTECRYFRV